MRRFLSALLKLVVSATVIVFLLRRIGVDAVTQQLGTADIGWLVTALVVFAASNVLGAIQWRWFLAARGIALSLPTVLAYYHVGLFFNNFLLGYVGGDVFRIYDAARASGKPVEAASAVFLDRLVGFVALTTMAVVGSVVWFSLFRVGGAVALGSVLLLAAWCAAFVALFHPRVARKLFAAVKFFFPSPLRGRLNGLYWQLNAFRHDRWLLARAYGLSLAIQALRVMVHVFTALAVGMRANMLYFAVFIPIIALISSLPVTFGGIGIREQTGVTLFGRVGLPPAQAMATEFLAYLVGVFSSLPGGVYFLLRREQLKPVPQLPVTNGEESHPCLQPQR
ncbi:MAG: flippase-like domain-containing protein [candidate division KSB1 bacterium]|nr:flippase-like domain-containing protein [candidate division KSB1 bacterium]